MHTSVPHALRRWQEKKQDLRDLTEEFEQERKEMLEMIQELDKRVSICLLVVFVWLCFQQLFLMYYF